MPPTPQTTTPPTGGPPRQGEPLLTRFFVLEANDDLTVWTYLGDLLARDRDQALRRYFPDPDKVDRKVRVAVSENAWKPKPVGNKQPPARLEIGAVVPMPDRSAQSTPPAPPKED